MRTVPAGGVVPTSWPPDFQQGMMLSSNRLRVPALTPGPARHSGANTETSAYSRFRIAEISGGVMPEGSLVRLAGSERGSLPDVTDTAPVATSERAEVTYRECDARQFLVPVPHANGQPSPADPMHPEQPRQRPPHR